VDLCGTGLGPMSSSCECGNEILFSLKCGEFFDLIPVSLLRRIVFHADGRLVSRTASVGRLCGWFINLRRNVFKFC
jgi:hypothetical protein